MNKPSFKTEYVNLAQGDRMGKYLAFYFFIDGIKIKMEPDAQKLFWDEEGTAIGDTESISINDHYEVKLNIKELQEWLLEYEHQCLLEYFRNQAVGAFIKKRFQRIYEIAQKIIVQVIHPEFYYVASWKFIGEISVV